MRDKYNQVIERFEYFKKDKNWFVKDVEFDKDFRNLKIYVDYDTFSVVYQVETNSNMHTLFSNYYAPNSNKTTTHVLTKSSSSHTPKNPTQAQINKMSAKITNVTTDHNVYENGKKGMRIHVKFDANDMLGFAGWCIAWFGDSKKNLLKYYGTSTYTNNSNNIFSSQYLNLCSYIKI